MAAWKTVTGLVIAFILVFMGVRAGGTPTAFIDVPSILFVAGIALPLTWIRGWSWSRLRHQIVLAGAIGTMIGLMSMLHHLDDPAALGPWIATAMIPLWYGLIGAAVCRAFEVEDSDDTGAVANSCC